jgi:predicted flavoprotein YhiN
LEEFKRQFLKILNWQQCPILHEMLDWDAPTGGYLLQACAGFFKII